MRVTTQLFWRRREHYPRSPISRISSWTTVLNHLNSHGMTVCPKSREIGAAGISSVLGAETFHWRHQIAESRSWRVRKEKEWFCSRLERAINQTIRMAIKGVESQIQELDWLDLWFTNQASIETTIATVWTVKLEKVSLISRPSAI